MFFFRNSKEIRFGDFERFVNRSRKDFSPRTRGEEEGRGQHRARSLLFKGAGIVPLKARSVSFTITKINEVEKVAANGRDNLFSFLFNGKFPRAKILP